jgi:hypothetical protein
MTFNVAIAKALLWTTLTKSIQQLVPVYLLESSFLLKSGCNEK